MVNEIWKFDQNFWDDFDKEVFNFGLNNYSSSIKKMKSFIVKGEQALETNIAKYMK